MVWLVFVVVEWGVEEDVELIEKVLFVVNIFI